MQLSLARMVFYVASLVLIWGLSWPIYKVAVNYAPPILFAGMRTLFGGLALGLFVWSRWKNVRFRQCGRIYLISAFLNVFLFFGLQTVGLTYMPGGLFTVLVYIYPVLVGVFAWLWLGESMPWPKIAGLVLGFLGVAAVSAESIIVELSPVGVVLALLTAISWALGTVYLKKVGQHVDLILLVVLQSVLGGAALTGIGLLVESWSDIVWNVPFLFGLLFGVILAVPTAWVLYFILVRSGEASKIAACMFLVPLIAVVISTFVLEEPFSLLLLFGLVLIVLSIYLVNRKTGSTGKKVERKLVSGHGH